MEQLLNDQSITPFVVIYIIMGFMVAARVHYAMLERRPKYKIHHYLLALVFNFLLWPLKLIQLFFVWMFEMVGGNDQM